MTEGVSMSAENEAAAAEARALEQARLRKERREAKIRAGGASRLNKISGLGGGLQRGLSTTTTTPASAAAPANRNPITKQRRSLPTATAAATNPRRPRRSRHLRALLPAASHRASAPILPAPAAATTATPRPRRHVRGTAPPDDARPRNAEPRRRAMRSGIRRHGRRRGNGRPDDEDDDADDGRRRSKHRQRRIALPIPIPASRRSGRKPLRHAADDTRAPEPVRLALAPAAHGRGPGTRLVHCAVDDLQRLQARARLRRGYARHVRGGGGGGEPARVGQALFLGVCHGRGRAPHLALLHGPPRPRPRPHGRRRAGPGRRLPAA
ncbi:hypothetical protein B0T22DRAFT_249720 [Podospora appendiculata]|uniref:Uncharacterized protein n=1 Tax=Podospora appendiculata TaxID=314037 RepID=A0AAE1C8Y5_9PEZI|nr:hypothetical protein B0T22DRAFT_249720 [Podospora appendiculata]